MTLCTQESKTKPFTQKTGADAALGDEISEESQIAQFRHVIVALSGEAEVDRLVHDVAQQVACLMPVDLHYVSVVSPLTGPAAVGGIAPGALAVMPSHLDQEDLDAAIDTRRKVIAEFARSGSASMAHDVVVRTGAVDEEIAAAADEIGASLIVVGSGERSWLEDLFCTDVAHLIIARATCPVMVIPERSGS